MHLQLVSFYDLLIFYFLNITCFVHLFISWWKLGCFYFLALMNNATVNIWIYETMWDVFSFLFNIYLWVELLDHMLVLCFIIQGTYRLLSKVAAWFYSATNMVRVFWFFYTQSSIYCCLSYFYGFLILAIQVDVKWYHTMAWIYISLMTNDVEHFL